MVAVEQKQRRLSGVQRAAGLLVALGPEASGKVLARFKEHEVGRLTWEITNLGNISPEQKEELLKDAYNTALNQDFATAGGIDTAMAIREEAFGPERGRELAAQIFQDYKKVPFSCARELDAGPLVSFLASEHPQTVALILSYVHADKAAAVLSQLPAAVQAEVAVRIARMERTAPEVVNEVEELMQRKLAAVLTQRQDTRQSGGPQALV